MHESPAFLLGAYFFGIVKGEQLLTRCGESGVQREGGGIRNTPPYLWPARSAKPFDQKKKPAPRHQRVKPLPSASLNKRPKQPLLCRVCVAEPLRVPLDAEAEVRVRLFQRFHNAVLAEGGYF